jgi:lipid-binding SYLF domain-containing protein
VLGARRAVLASKHSLQPDELAGGVAQATIHVQPIFNASNRALAQFSTGQAGDYEGRTMVFRSILHAIVCFTALMCCFIQPSAVCAQSREDATVMASANVLNEIMAVPLSSIPRAMLADAEGIAIIPNVLKGSFVIGARHGYGVLLVRAEDRQWHAPAFISLTGGNVGWQIGVQSTDVVLVFKTRKSIEGILSGKFTLGADAAAAAGPVGRNASVGTDARLSAEIYSYSRSRGLFAGVSLDGSVISVDHFANAAYYRSPGPGQPAAVPPAATELVRQVASYVDANATQSAAHAQLPQQHAVHEADAARNELARMAPVLYDLLDEQWKSYLALPAEIFAGGQPSQEALQNSLLKFETVRTDPRYRDLAERPEFQSTLGLLKHSVAAMSQDSQSINLPPPPAR